MVTDHGGTDRMHMLIGATVNSWLTDLSTRTMGTGGGQAA
jgi:hypothetical protein